MLTNQEKKMNVNISYMHLTQERCHLHYLILLKISGSIGSTYHFFLNTLHRFMLMKPRFIMQVKSDILHHQNTYFSKYLVQVSRFFKKLNMLNITLQRSSALLIRLVSMDLQRQKIFFPRFQSGYQCLHKILLFSTVNS